VTAAHTAVAHLGEGDPLRAGLLLLTSCGSPEIKITVAQMASQHIAVLRQPV